MFRAIILLWTSLFLFLWAADGQDQREGSFGGDCIAGMPFLSLKCDLSEKGYLGLSVGQTKQSAFHNIEELWIDNGRQRISTYNEAMREPRELATGARQHNGYGRINFDPESRTFYGDIDADLWFFSDVTHSRWRWSYRHTGSLIIEFDDNDQISGLAFEASFTL